MNTSTSRLLNYNLTTRNDGELDSLITCDNKHVRFLSGDLQNLFFALSTNVELIPSFDSPAPLPLLSRSSPAPLPLLSHSSPAAREERERSGSGRGEERERSGAGEERSERGGEERERDGRGTGGMGEGHGRAAHKATGANYQS